MMVRGLGLLVGCGCIVSGRASWLQHDSVLGVPGDGDAECAGVNRKYLNDLKRRGVLEHTAYGLYRSPQVPVNPMTRCSHCTGLPTRTRASSVSPHLDASGSPTHPLRSRSYDVCSDLDQALAWANEFIARLAEA